MKLIKFLISLPLLFIIGFYKYIISPLTPPTCRHSPSCSEYASQAIKEWGLMHGSWLFLNRIIKCNPWGTHGFDPVPKKKSNKQK
jgi:putative membrane protein insertion efficiency factor|tara:strand:- start:1214 stop:1468 length:255 start_codon:yes stop_codon:yes gene_type:complete